MSKVKFGKPTTYSVGPVGGIMTEYRYWEALQCKSKGKCAAIGQRCQGVQGHKGMCWCYGPDGWLHRWKQEKDIKGPYDIAAESTPPGHKRYINPAEKMLSHYRTFRKRQKIREFRDRDEMGAKTIKKLEKAAELAVKHAKRKRK